MLVEMWDQFVRAIDERRKLKLCVGVIALLNLSLCVCGCVGGWVGMSGTSGLGC